MIHLTAILKKFASQGEKTGWTYIEIPEEKAQQLKPGNKKTFRVKGKLDNYSFKQIALLPMGNGGFIMAVNAVMRKAIGKKMGITIKAPRPEKKKFSIIFMFDDSEFNFF